MVQEVKNQNTNQESPQVVDPQIESAEAVAENLEKKDEGTPADKTIEELAQADEAEVKAEPAAEAAPVQIPQEVAAVGVAPKEEGAKEVLENHAIGDIQPAGEHHPVQGVEGESIQLPDETFNTKDAKAVQNDPSSAIAAHNLVEERKGLLSKMRGFANKFLAGSKISEQSVVSTPENLVQFPSAPSNPASAQEVKKAT